MPEDAEHASRHQIFVSYAREDEAVTGKLVSHLEELGWKVFWDRQFRGGDEWPRELEAQLLIVKCVVVLWSKNSVQSDWVKEEARYGRSRQVLVAARIDDSSPPFGFTGVHADDLSGWHDELPPEGIVQLTNRVRELVEVESEADRSEQDEKIILEQKKTRPEHISLSNHDADREAVLSQLGDMDAETVHKFIEDGYRELQAAQHAARSIIDDRAPENHYASAADHFKNALDAMGAAKNRKARDGRPIEYFLLMERANALAFSDPSKPDAHRDAVAIYETLSQRRNYRNDAPIFFRLGCALARRANDEATIQKAIRHLGKARQLAHKADESRGITDELLSEGAWIYFEVAKQLGYCNYLLSDLPGVQSMRRQKYLEDAIRCTREATERPIPANDPGDLIKFTVLKARGNLVYLLADKLRAGWGDSSTRDATREEIARLIKSIKEQDSWDIAVNQVSIIDSVAYAAATVGDWATAKGDACLNVENLSSIAVRNGLSDHDMALLARAKEILFFSELFLVEQAAQKERV